MSIWEELGIERTDNAREIKRAYAAKLKLVHPEEHPEEFQKLHEAYCTALKLAKTKARPHKSDVEIPQINITADKTDKTPPEFDFDKEIFDCNKQIAESAQERTPDVIRRMEELYNKKGFVSKEEWLELFNSYDVQKIKEQPVFIDALYSFLKTHFIDEKLALAVFESFIDNRELLNENDHSYDKVFYLVGGKCSAYRMRTAKNKNKRTWFDIVMYLLIGLMLIFAGFAFYMAYKSGQLDEIIHSFRGLIV